VTYKLEFAELLPYWDVLALGLLFTIVLTLVSTVVGVSLGTAAASARTFGPRWLGHVVDSMSSSSAIRRSSCSCSSSSSGCHRSASS
jgi:ABC-type amino acid transport system permease subunit